MTGADAGDVGEMSVALVAVDAGAQLECIGYRHVHDRLQTVRIEVAAATFNVAFEIIGRLLRHDQHRAAGRVAAEQGALRPLEHLHRSEEHTSELQSLMRTSYAF